MRPYQKEEIYADNREVLINVEKVLEIIMCFLNCDKKHPKQHHYYIFLQNLMKQQNDIHRNNKSIRCYGNECNLIKHCFVSHRFFEAAKLLSALTVNRSVISVVLFRASLLTVENLQLPCEAYMKKLICNFRNLRNCDKKELTLELIIHGLKRNLTLLEIDNDLKEIVVRGREHMYKKNPVIDSLIKAYTGLFYYVEWCNDCIGDTQSESSKSFAEKAIQHFSHAVEMPHGDIFVLKSVEMLKYLGQIDEIEELLTKYVEFNPNHLNSYIYLCTFLEEYQRNAEKQLKYLIQLSEMCPSDVRVLLLIQKWKESGTPVKKCLKHLYLFLDYPSNTDSIEAWNMMLVFLLELGQTPDVANSVKSYWVKRKAVWNYVHFNPENLLISSNSELVAYKAGVLLLHEPDHTYIKQALRFKDIHNIMQRTGLEENLLKSLHFEIQDTTM